MKFSLVYVTVGNLEEARKIGQALVEARLAACVNLIDHMQSFYMWEGKLEEGNEVVLTAKTRESSIPALIEKINKMHSYECPCVVALPITTGHLPFINWIEEQTA